MNRLKELDYRCCSWCGCGCGCGWTSAHTDDRLIARTYIGLASWHLGLGLEVPTSSPSHLQPREPTSTTIHHHLPPQFGVSAAFFPISSSCATMSAALESKSQHEPQTKKFGKQERTVPHKSQKASKWYPAEDQKQPRKVSHISPKDNQHVSSCSWTKLQPQHAGLSPGNLR